MRDRAATAFCQNEPNLIRSKGADLSRGAVRFCQNEPNLVRVWTMIESMGLQLAPNPNYDVCYGGRGGALTLLESCGAPAAHCQGGYCPRC